MKKIYHLSSCSTCQRIIKEINPNDEVILQDIKTETITENQLEDMKTLAGNYEALFSKRAQLYRKLGLHEQTLSENQYRDLIIKHYTFLKRPVMIINDQIYIGNSKKTVGEAITAFNS